SRPARSRRNRKVYAITPAGEARLHELLLQPAHDDREFVLQVAFCRFLPQHERIELFKRRRDELTARLRTRHETGRDRYLRSVRERDSQTIQHDIAWLDRLIAEEEGVELDHASESHPDDPNDPVTAVTPDPALPGGSR